MPQARHSQRTPAVCIIRHSYNPEDLAAAILAIYRDPERSRAMAGRAAALCREQYRWGVQREGYLGLYADLIAGRQGRGITECAATPAATDIGAAGPDM